MKLFQFVLSALIYQASYQAAVKERILFGHELGEGQHIPYQVQLAILVGIDEALNCGGSLISEQYVLTAEHCLENGKMGIPVKVAMSFGSKTSRITDLQSALFSPISPYKGIQVCRIQDCWIHSPDNDRSFRRDIALIKLPQTIEFSTTIHAVKLPSWSDTEWDFNDKTAVISGWGRTENGLRSNTLLFAYVTIIADKSKCNYYYGGTQYNICSARQPFTQEPSTCMGDSGGPVVVGDKQVGIVSYGRAIGKACPNKKGSVYTSVIPFLRWISDKTGIEIEM